MKTNNSIILNILSLFFIPVIIGSLAVLLGANRSLSMFITLPIILVLLGLLIIKLIKNARQNFSQFDDIFKQLGFEKITIFFLLTSYEKKLGNSILKIMYGPSRASYESRFNITLNLNCPNNFIIGRQKPINSSSLQEITNFFPENLADLKLFSNNSDWSKMVFSQEKAINAIRQILSNQNLHSSISVTNGELLVRILFNQIDYTEIKKLIESIEILVDIIKSTK